MQPPFDLSAVNEPRATNGNPVFGERMTDPWGHSPRNHPYDKERAVVDAFGTTKIDRDDLPVGHSLCEYCQAKCCRYFALPIETPTTMADFEFMRWYLLHDRASVFKEEGDWYLLVHTTCKHLLPDNRCGIYTTRPEICRDYTTENCEYEDDWTYEFYLETPEQVSEYAEAVMQPKGKSIRSPKPELLPVL